MNTSAPKKGGWNCFGVGCLVLAVIFAIVAVFAGWIFHRTITRLREYSSESPVQLTIESADPGEYDALVKRVDTFKKTAPGSDQHLALTAHDINLLLAYSPEWQPVKGKFCVTSITGGIVHLQMSIPLRALPLLRDRYLNGHVDFVPWSVHKVLHIDIHGMKFGGRPLAHVSMKKFAYWLEPNLTNRLLGDPVIGSVLIRTETLWVEGDTLEFISAK